MARWLALMAIIAVGSGCAVKVPTGAVPQYDYTEYETYDQPLNADVSLGFGNPSNAAPQVQTRAIASGSVRGLR